MENIEYRKLAEMEDHMWWFRALHANFLMLLGRFLEEPKGRLLDEGCGTGGQLFSIRRAFPGIEAFGIDISPWAAAMAREKSGARVTVGSVNELPFADGQFAAIVSSDVLYHARVDDAAAVRGAYRCLAPGGVLIIHAPAYEWLRGAHDEQAHTARRYTRSGVSDLLTEAGFNLAYTTYWNTLLFPLMVLRRKVFRPREGGSDVMAYPALVEALFGGVMAIELGLLRLGLWLPFGGSVMAVGVKHD